MALKKLVAKNSSMLHKNQVRNGNSLEKHSLNPKDLTIFCNEMNNMKGDSVVRGASRKRGTKLLWCDQCKGNYCLKGYAEVKPSYCRAVDDPDILESTPGKYLKPETARFHMAASRLHARQKEH